MRIAAPAEEEEEGERYKLRRIRGEGGGSGCWVRSCYRMDDDMPLTGKNWATGAAQPFPSPSRATKKWRGRGGGRGIMCRKCSPTKKEPDICDSNVGENSKSCINLQLRAKVTYFRFQRAILSLLHDNPHTSFRKHPPYIVGGSSKRSASNPPPTSSIKPKKLHCTLMGTPT